MAVPLPTQLLFTSPPIPHSITPHNNMYTNDDTLHFIAAHRNDNVPQLALAAHNAPNVDLPFALDQIAGWQTACRKPPSGAPNPHHWRKAAVSLCVS